MTKFYFVRHGEPDYDSEGEWDSDRTHTIKDGEELFRLCKEFDACNGIYPEGIEKNWDMRL